ncbi:MAG: AAA domain-containing protein, partial [Dehalococcoidales bacterium]|nr:AAA domain-containing protein [Dehalococcoidales bacterium]
QEEILSKPELQERFEIGSPEAKESMFQRFQRLLPIENKVKLTEQYRMVAPIRELISHCFYEDELTGGRTNIDPVLCSCTGKSINWLSTSKLDKRFEQVAGHSRTNSEEASRICNIISSIDNKLVRKRVSDEKKVLILSGYDAQLRLLKSRINQIVRDIKILKIECLTIDQVQGREADIVVFSLTRSNQESNVGFLKELERVNVAISRARELLYIVGDDRFVTRADNSEHLLKVLNHVKQRPDHCYFEELKN